MKDSVIQLRRWENEHSKLILALGMGLSFLFLPMSFYLLFKMMWFCDLMVVVCSIFAVRWMFLGDSRNRQSLCWKEKEMAEKIFFVIGVLLVLFGAIAVAIQLFAPLSMLQISHIGQGFLIMVFGLGWMVGAIIFRW